MQKPNNTSGYYTTRQLKLPPEIEKIIDIADPVYSFCDVMDHIDLTRYLAIKDRRTGRPRCDAIKLLPAYNMQAAVCDEYIAAVDVKHYASDMDCFIPLMEKFKSLYGHYPKYPVADAGYGSYNNYLYCEEHGIEKFMKFTMFEKETKDEKYRTNPYRIMNFKRDENGDLICPNGKRFIYKYDRHVRGNKYGRTEEIYECEDCEGCPYREDCCKRESGNRTARLNRELTSFHEEVIVWF